MKKLCIFVLLIAVILCNSSFVFADDATPLFKFACMSDLHLDDKLIQGTHSNWKQLDMVLSAASSKGYTDLFLCDGDVSSYGDTDVWYEARTKIQNAGFNTLLWALGNHAYGTTYVNNDADEDFKVFIGKDSIFYHEVICGYHFLCMGAEKSDLSVSLGAEVYSDAQYEWLATELQAAAEDSEGKPIFVASHYPTEEDGVGERLIPLLSQYDNVVFFWGHEHWSDYADYALSQYIWTSDGFVNARTGCLSYGYSNLADVLLVDV